MPKNPHELIEKEFVFGDTTIVRGVDSRENQQLPSYYIKILEGNRLIALYPGLSFWNIAASKDNRVFVAVSNGGSPGNALVVFSSSGKIHHLLRHFWGNLEYCTTSVTLQREWYNDENPEIEFTYSEDGYVKNVLINSCKNERLTLKELVETHNNKRNDLDGSFEPPIR